MLTHNADTWVKIANKTLKVLDDLFIGFCQKIFRVEVGCPRPSFYWESGTYRFNNIILQKKLLFVHHLANLSPVSLRRQMYDLQVENSLENTLHQECLEHLIQMGITNLREISKWQYKRIVRKYIHTKARGELLNDIQRYKKLSHDKLSCEPLERKKYLSTLSLENARMRFRVSSSFVQGVRTHFPRKYRPLSLSCPACSDPDASATNENARNVSVSSPINQSHDNLTHILRCGAYSDLRGESFNPSDDKELAEFFTNVVQRRIETGDI